MHRPTKSPTGAEWLESSLQNALQSRFHVMQAINKELKALKNKEKKEHPQALKGAHYALLKNQEDLTERQQEA